jgi:hypothetical protein
MPGLVGDATFTASQFVLETSRPAMRAFVSHWSVVSRPSERTDEACRVAVMGEVKLTEALACGLAREG